jgi:hypothetical protein
MSADNLTEPDALERYRRAKARGAPYSLRDMSPAEGFREYLEDLVGAELIAVRQLGRDGERWQLLLSVRGEERTVELTASDLGRPQEFKLKVWRVTRSTPKLRRGELDHVLDALGEALDSDLGEVVDSVMSRSEETREWLVDYLGGLGKCDASDQADLYDALRSPAASFEDLDGRLYVRLPELARHVHAEYGQRTSHRDLSARLGELGFERRQHAVRPPGGGEPAKARYWVSPEGFDPRA